MRAVLNEMRPPLGPARGLRGDGLPARRAAAGQPRHPAYGRAYLACFAIPWVWVMPPEKQERGAHLITASTPRIPDACVDPRVKNFHWGDLTRALFEAHDRGADQPHPARPRGQRHRGAGLQRLRRDRRRGGRRPIGASSRASRARPCSSCARSRSSLARPGRCRSRSCARPTRSSSPRPPAGSCRRRGSTAGSWATTGPGRSRAGCGTRFWAKRAAGLARDAGRLRGAARRGITTVRRRSPGMTVALGRVAAAVAALGVCGLAWAGQAAAQEGPKSPTRGRDQEARRAGLRRRHRHPGLRLPGQCRPLAGLRHRLLPRDRRGRAGRSPRRSDSCRPPPRSASPSCSRARSTC